LLIVAISSINYSDYSFESDSDDEIYKTAANRLWSGDDQNKMKKQKHDIDRHHHPYVSPSKFDNSNSNANLKQFDTHVHDHPHSFDIDSTSLNKCSFISKKQSTCAPATTSKQKLNTPATTTKIETEQQVKQKAQTRELNLNATKQLSNVPEIHEQHEQQHGNKNKKK
jgi:hypothetical protein